MLDLAGDPGNAAQNTRLRGGSALLSDVLVRIRDHAAVAPDRRPRVNNFVGNVVGRQLDVDATGWCIGCPLG